MRVFTQSPFRTLVLAIVLVGSTMCSGDNVLGVENQLMVSLAPDNFAFKVSNMSNVSQSLSYNWITTGDSAVVSNSSNLIGGTVAFTVRGPGGGVLFQSALTTNGSAVTMHGTPGSWQIEFVFSKTDGNVTLTVVKAP